MVRKGASSRAKIPLEILEQLNKGQIESVNLVEWLAVDQLILLETVLKEGNQIDFLKIIKSKLLALKPKTVNTISREIGKSLIEIVKDNFEFWVHLQSHRSDTVRNWCCYSIGLNENLSTKEIFEQIELFAKDKHFGVREVAWMAVRERIIANLEMSLKILENWTANKDENIRRFASEATRPRGVWSKHINKLKENPEMGVSLLNQLKCDPSKYVRDSVGNWLNDASKSQPQFVITLCKSWLEDCHREETQYIVKKALRSIKG
jgi:3-methyladenine DNA glycosylase AlkC